MADAAGGAAAQPGEVAGPEWAALPAACLLRVLTPLAAADVAAAACVCVAWRAAAADGRLWRGLCRAERPPRGSVRASCSLGAAADAEATDEDGDASDDDKPAAHDWRSALRAARAARERMLAGTPTRAHVLRGHTDFVRCLAVRQGLILTAASSVRMQDCSLRLWHLTSGACLARWTGHSGPIWCMDWRGGTGPAATGSEDGTVKLWDVAAAAASSSARSDYAEEVAAEDLRRAEAPPSRPPLSLVLGAQGAGRRSVTAVALDAQSRTVAACGAWGTVVAWHLRRVAEDAEEAAEAQEEAGASAVGQRSGAATPASPAHAASSAPALCVAAGEYRGASANCLQLSRAGDLLAWGCDGGAVGVARVPSPDDVGSGSGGNGGGPASAALSFPTGALSVTTLSFDAAASAGGPLAHALLVGSNAGLTALHGALSRGVAGDATLPGCAAVPLLSASAGAVTCHQQGVGGAPAVIAAATRSGALHLVDARAPPVHGDGSAWRAGVGSTALCLHACGHALFTGHENGGAYVWDTRSGGGAGPQRPVRGCAPHADRLWALHADERALVTAGLDATVTVREWGA
jgi:hypothetical protein